MTIVPDGYDQTAEDLARAMRMFAAGLTPDDIVADLGRSRAEARDWFAAWLRERLARNGRRVA